MTKINPSAESTPANATGEGAAHTLTIKFPKKYESLYQELQNSAENEDRELGQYVLLYLRDHHKQEG